jgi:hypothetical protein
MRGAWVRVEASAYLPGWVAAPPGGSTLRPGGRGGVGCGRPKRKETLANQLPFLSKEPCAPALSRHSKVIEITDCL